MINVAFPPSPIRKFNYELIFLRKELENVRLCVEKVYLNKKNKTLVVTFGCYSNMFFDFFDTLGKDTLNAKLNIYSAQGDPISTILLSNLIITDAHMEFDSKEPKDNLKETVIFKYN